MNKRNFLVRGVFFALLLSSFALFCGNVAVGQESQLEGNELPVLTNVAETGVIQVQGKHHPVWIFSNRPVSSGPVSDASFYYTQVPLVELPHDFYDTENGTIDFSINLLWYDGSDYARKSDEAAIRAKIAGQNNITDKKDFFPLVPLSITAYKVFLRGSYGESEEIASGTELAAGRMLSVKGKVKSESIRRELESAPERVSVSVSISHPFRVLNIKLVSAHISTALIDSAIEDVARCKPEENRDMFISRNIHQSIVRRIQSNVVALFPDDMSESLRKRWEEVSNRLLEIPPVTEEDLNSVSAQNVVVTPATVQKDLSPTVIKRITTALKTNESYTSYVENIAKSIKEIAKKDDNAERFYNELQETWKKSGSGSTSGKFGLGIGKLTIGGNSSISGDFSTEGTYESKSEREKHDIAEFQQKIASDETSINDISSAISTDWLGAEEIDKVLPKDFELVRVNKALFARTVSVFIGEFKELPHAKIPRRYDLSLRDVVYIQPPVHTGTIVAYWGKEDSSKENGGAPSGYLFCNGASIPEGSQYQALREHLKAQTPDITQEGNNTPDLRGMFVRGIGGIRPGDLGSTQNESFHSHAHGITPDGKHTPTMKKSGDHSHKLPFYKNSAQSGGSRAMVDCGHPDRKELATVQDGAHAHTMNEVPSHSHGGATQVSGGGNPKTVVDAPDETRPVNMGVNYIIKY